MNETERRYEKWVWLDLMGFDNREDDLGVAKYIDAAGFTPHAICLMMSSVDFVLMHEGIEQERALAPDFCSRGGHAFNQDRERQEWTNHQVRGLIDRFHDHGTDVYLSVFTGVLRHNLRHEWASDHREVLQVWNSERNAHNINSLARLKDGSYYEDFFLARLLEVITDYGFDGWHGADGYGPLSGPIYEVDFSDDMIGQFAETQELALPDIVTQECNDDLDKLKTRSDWIWRNKRREWIEFWTDRWADFWQKMVNAIHDAGKKAVINSAWTRGPFEAIYRYGIDYSKIAKTGVDGIVVETVAGGVALGSGRDVHYDYLAMLQLIKAYVPQTKLIFLHSVHDIVEQWDLLRHAPPVLEKEIYSLANVYHTDAHGTLGPCVDGFLVCLGDGLSRDEWRWLRDRWHIAFSPPPLRTLGPTVVWSDAALRNQIGDFTNTRTWTAHRILFHLTERGVPVQSTLNVASLDKVRGTILVINPYLYPEEELKKVLAYANGPIVLVGRRPESLPQPDLQFDDVYGPNALSCVAFGVTATFRPKIEKDGEEQIPADIMGITDPRVFRDDIYFRKVSDGFLDACARVILEATACITLSKPTMTWYHGTGEESVGVMIMEQEEGKLRLAIKNNSTVYAAPQIDVHGQVDAIEVLSAFPLVRIRPDGSQFGIKVPPKGVVVVDVTMTKPQMRTDRK